MSYAVKELYLTVQGEGAQAGRAAVFVRFAGCNLWSGREEDRSAAVCTFCDTDFVGGRRFDSAEPLAIAARRLAQSTLPPLVVFTGGEPALQLDNDLLDEFRHLGFSEFAIETNGTIDVSRLFLTWVTVSPKAGSQVVQRRGDELKLVYPQRGLMPDSEEIDDLARGFDHLFLQPMDGPHRDENTKWAIEWVKKHPQWRLSTQVHKYVGIP